MLTVCFVALVSFKSLVQRISSVKVLFKDGNLLGFRV